MLEVGRDEEARQVVHKLHGAKTAEEKVDADDEFAVMYESIKAEKLLKSKKLSDLWATAAMRRRTLVACCVQIFGQFTGINGLFSIRFFRFNT